MNCSKEKLEKLICIDNKSYTYIGKLYNVSGNAVKKYAKKIGIDLPKRRKINPNEIFSHSKCKNNLVFNLDDEDFIKIIKESSTWKDIGLKLGYKVDKKRGLSSNVKHNIDERCQILGISLNINLEKNNDISNKTKGELFENRKSWQSARSSIAKNARDVFFENNINPKCLICGYTHHIEIAHIKPVSEFDDGTLVKEINDKNNLIPLCPNHHWEYDNGILDIKKIIKY